MDFMNENFLLKNKTAQKLFFDYAKDMPIFDFHCHLSPKAIYENNKFADISEAWLGGDHYKWRAMRSLGLDEKYITGDAPGCEKFAAFAKTLQYAVGNPLYHWAHLELQRFFGVTEPLTEKNAKNVFDKVNEQLATDDFRVRNLITKSNVKVIYTTDDPIDDLQYHGLIEKEQGFATKVCPAFRPDKAININVAGFEQYIKSLEKAANVNIENFEDVLTALENRIEFFDKAGCKASDHGVTTVPYAEASNEELNGIFKRAMNNEPVEDIEYDKYKTAVFKFLAGQYVKHNWVMEIHVGVLRNNNTKMFKKLGPDTGYDSIGDFSHAENLVKFLDSCEQASGLPKTILFCANPNDNYILGTMIGCFQDSSAMGKIQFGTAWWFNDSIDGMQTQMAALGNLGVLGTFVGMLTDSRSFLSYPRHEYFRRILCNMLGNLIENGEYYADDDFLRELVQGICINNALKYFGE